MCKSSLHSCGLKCRTSATIETSSERLWLWFFHTIGTSQWFFGGRSTLNLRLSLSVRKKHAFPSASSPVLSVTFKRTSPPLGVVIWVRVVSEMLLCRNSGRYSHSPEFSGFSFWSASTDYIQLLVWTGISSHKHAGRSLCGAFECSFLARATVSPSTWLLCWISAWCVRGLRRVLCAV